MGPWFSGGLGSVWLMVELDWFSDLLIFLISSWGAWHTLSHCSQESQSRSCEQHWILWKWGQERRLHAQVKCPLKNEGNKLMLFKNSLQFNGLISSLQWYHICETKWLKIRTFYGGIRCHFWLHLKIFLFNGSYTGKTFSCSISQTSNTEFKGTETS